MSEVLCCMFVAGMGVGYLKNEDVTEPDLFDVKVNHSSVVARKGLQSGVFLLLVFFFLLVWYCNSLGALMLVEWFIFAVKYV